MEIKPFRIGDMEKPIIYIQPDVFWEDEHGAVLTSVAACNQGFQCHIMQETKDYSPGASRNIVVPSFRGSLDFARRFGHDFKYANALHWLPKFRSKCVNHEGYFNDLAEALHVVRHQGAHYIRPASPFKEFTGQIFTAESLAREISFMEQNKNLHADEIICVIAPAKHIVREWRCIFVNDKYVGGSQYLPDILWNVPESIIKFAEEIAADPYFANIFNYVIDVGIVNNQPKLVEINGFETASFYAANVETVYGAWAHFLKNPNEEIQ